MSPDKLVMMANQIGTFFDSQGPGKTVPGVVDHIKKFWERRMREAIYAHIDHGGEGLQPDVRRAFELIRISEKAA